MRSERGEGIVRQMDLWKLSLLNVFASPFRSVLTVLGIAIGAGAILAVLTLGEAGRTQVRTELNRLGIDKVWITAGESNTLDLGDAQTLADALEVRTAETIYLAAEVAKGARCETMTVMGCEKAYLDMMNAKVASGRNLYPLEWKKGSRCAMLGRLAAEKLGVSAGEIITIDGIPFLICGILTGSETFSKVDMESAVFLPVETVKAAAGAGIHEIMVDVPKDIEPQTIAAMAQNVMQKQRGIRVETLTLQVQMDAADSIVRIFVEVLKWVAVICILVGGIGVMNILLVSVRERRREIGVMKSLGTTHKQICAIFLMEALAYASIGGVLGILLGMGLIAAAGASIGLTTAVKPLDCILVYAAALLTGLGFGVAPASRASALSCVEALRNE